MGPNPASVTVPLPTGKSTAWAILAWTPWLLASILSAVLIFRVGQVLHQRITGPRDFDVLSGAIVDHCVRVRHGLPIFAEPDATFVPLLYTPGYYYIASGLMALLGESYQACQFTSLALLIGSAGLMAGVVWMITRSVWATIMVVPLIACGYPITDFYYDDPRVDPAVAFTMAAAILLSVRSRTWPYAAALGVMLTLAFWCKQTSVIFSSFLLLGLLVCRWKTALIAGGVYGVLSSLSVLILNRRTNGWLWTLIYEVPRTHDLKWDLAMENARADWLGPLLVPCLLALVATIVISRTWKGDESDRRTGLLGIALTAVAAYTLASRSNVGATEKLLIPAVIVFSAVIPVAFWRLEQSLGSIRGRSMLHFATGCVASLIVWFSIFEPSDALMDANEKALWARVGAEIERYSELGPVWTPWGYITTTIVGQGMRPNQMALTDYLGGRFGPATGLPVPPDLDRAFREQRFAAVFYMAQRNKPFRTLLLKTYKDYYVPDHFLPIKQGDKTFREGVGIAVPRRPRIEPVTQ